MAYVALPYYDVFNPVLRAHKPRFLNLANDPTLPPELRGDLQIVSLFRR